MTQQQQPSPAEVGTMYNQFTDIFMQSFGGNIHFGYWENEEDDSSIEVATDRLTDLVADRLVLAGAARVLDVGCGSGKASVRIAASRGLQVVGITVSDYQLQLAKTRPQDERLPGRALFHLADAMELPFEDSSFDGAYAIESILHMRDKNAVFGHLARVLRPGARLVMADFYQDGEISGEDADLVTQGSQLFQIPSLITADEYREYVHRAGLQLVEFTNVRENVQRTYDSFAATLRQAALTFGSEASSQLTDSASLAEQAERARRIPQIGYVLLTAVRP
jgi:ubiquinone/menaquinone biosynthesis C-methylase UbiE